jgi:hypothetical protein
VGEPARGGDALHRGKEVLGVEQFDTQLIVGAEGVFERRILRVVAPHHAVQPDALPGNVVYVVDEKTLYPKRSPGH